MFTVKLYRNFKSDDFEKINYYTTDSIEVSKHRDYYQLWLKTGDAYDLFYIESKQTSMNVDVRLKTYRFAQIFNQQGVLIDEIEIHDE